MKFREFQTVKASGFLHIPFSAAWSEENVVAVTTDKGVHVTDREWSRTLFKCMLVLLVCCTRTVFTTDITHSVFRFKTDFVPAAFGDFNSDEYTDLFIIKNDKRTLEILLGSESEPLLRNNLSLKCTFNGVITSVVPGDFDGDALLDVLVTIQVDESKDMNSVRVLWGELTTLDTKNASKELLRIHGQPLAIDHDRDMIMDLFGEKEENGAYKRMFWIFNKDRSPPIEKPMLTDEHSNRKFPPLRHPQSHAFIDLNMDSSADLYLSTTESYEVWLYDKENGFIFDPKNTIPFPDVKSGIFGQTLFMDMELDGKMDHIVPVCSQPNCQESALYVYSRGRWYNLKVNFHDSNNKQWGFVAPRKGEQNYFSNTITLHSGDFNMDGYTDLLVTLQSSNNPSSFLLENVECPKEKCDGFSRTFNILWNSLSPFGNNTVLGVFFDFAQNGILDILFVHQKIGKQDNPYISAYRNSPDYDANFIKVMVLTGLTNKEHYAVPTPLRRMRKIYGSSFPGPVIQYRTTTQEGIRRVGVAAQLAQSAYFSLQLPYTLFGLGRAPNFVETLTVGLGGENKTWEQIVPNSQIVVITNPSGSTRKWFAQLFVTPSKIIVQTILALLGTCALISIIIIVLWWKERRQDHQEKLQEAHRFHFDAM